MKLKNTLLFLAIFSTIIFLLMPAGHQHIAAQSTSTIGSFDFQLARVQYRGGGDWYNDPSALPNLIHYVNSNLPVSINPSIEDVSIGSRDIYKYPFLFLTGHGNITINSAEANNLREYLDRGGFLFIDDDYGLDEFIRPILKQIFPTDELVDLPFSHPIYHQVYSFDQGLPKIHEHDNKPPQGFAIFRNWKMVVFYGYESNISDGWTNADVHGVSEDLRVQSLKMGTNILQYALTSHRMLN